jgi:hypothetical protein
MDMADKETRRIVVRDLLDKSMFRLTKARDKSDEFKNSDGKAIYFFWKQGGGINIAIDPYLPFDALKSIPGIEFSKKNPYGIRDGSSMTDFPREYQGVSPDDANSKVGRMFVIEQTSFSEFMSTLVDIFSGKQKPRHDSVDAQPAAGIADEITDLTYIDVDGDTKNADSDKSGSQGYEQDPEMRSAVELYAESIATRHYESQGYQVEKFGKPFDLLCKKEGELIHVEVKGSRSKLDTVILTINEVSDAENAAWQSDLFVVDQIVVERNGKDLAASGGAARVIQKWVPAKEMLAPSQFRYRLPDESQWKFLK